MEQQYIPAEEIVKRLHNLRSEVTKREWDAVLIVQNVDLFYFSGTMQNALLFVPRDGEEILLVKKYGERAQRESAIAQVIPLNSWNDMPTLIVEHYGRVPQKMGIELDVIPAKIQNKIAVADTNAALLRRANLPNKYIVLGAIAETGSFLRNR